MAGGRPPGPLGVDPDRDRGESTSLLTYNSQLAGPLGLNDPSVGSHTSVSDEGLASAPVGASHAIADLISIPEILSAAGVRYAPYERSKQSGIYLTTASQLVGAYADIKSFQEEDPAYRGWHAHHVVEYQDFSRVGVTQSIPHRSRQLCVLIPEAAHIGRVNSVLRTQNPGSGRVSVKDLRLAYRDAYALIGDYCGGGEEHIRGELVAIVDAVFRTLGL